MFIKTFKKSEGVDKNITRLITLTKVHRLYCGIIKHFFLYLLRLISYLQNENGYRCCPNGMWKCALTPFWCYMA